MSQSTSQTISQIISTPSNKKTLEEWLNSDNIHLRYQCLLRDYGLGTLVHDKDVAIRMKMAELGKKLDVLIHDENKYVRAEVARQGYGLNVLMNDENFLVRTAVAEQKYGLDVLINDEDGYVRAHALENMDILTRTKTNP